MNIARNAHRNGDRHVCTSVQRVRGESDSREVNMPLVVYIVE